MAAIAPLRDSQGTGMKGMGFLEHLHRAQYQCLLCTYHSSLWFIFLDKCCCFQALLEMDSEMEGTILKSHSLAVVEMGFEPRAASWQSCSDSSVLHA